MNINITFSQAEYDALVKGSKFTSHDEQFKLVGFFIGLTPEESRMYTSHSALNDYIFYQEWTPDGSPLEWTTDINDFPLVTEYGLVRGMFLERAAMAEADA